MLKFILGLQITFWLGFVLGDVTTGWMFQAAFVAGYALVKLVPGKVWERLIEAFLDILPYLIIWNALSDS